MYLDFLDREVIIDIAYKPSYRSVTIQVKGPNHLRIKTYKMLGDKEIYDMLSKHKRFLLNHMVRPKVEIDEEAIHYLGEKYKLVIIQSDFDNVLVDDFKNEFKVYTRVNNPEFIKGIIHDFYNTTLRDIVYKYEDQIKKDMKISFDIKYDYKEVTTYFGECFSKRRYIILNTMLAKYELRLILSVIYHEYAHFYYPNHQTGFYKLLESVFPGYKETQKELRRIKYREIY
ncbi:MAG: M48 family metallopeptidase [Acholeplasmatales bacterium]|nr:M48 family metallopeptidase [Acholeplasmatales bacterium]